LEEVLVSSVTMSGHGAEDRLTENVTLNFAKFKEEYVPQKPDGTGDAAIEGTFHIAKNLKM
jgi:type VI secretion system secreted protein Hcp